ncbi:hypothetical protein D1627_13515 [Pontibacter oryzae]|uniref:Uncharacterized protein n=1 Tax=Pontibacter oryzae TaxID=2304593 RepID=A0A399S2C1_9BACT|nr:hypothetical protein D1627_13515 [Pontibacter oryzae]
MVKGKNFFGSMPKALHLFEKITLHNVKRLKLVSFYYYQNLWVNIKGRQNYVIRRPFMLK